MRDNIFKSNKSNRTYEELQITEITEAYLLLNAFMNNENQGDFVKAMSLISIYGTADEVKMISDISRRDFPKI